MINVELTDADDVQTVELVMDGGCGYRPPLGSKVFVSEISGSWKIVLGVDDGILQDLAEGEKEIYAVSDGSKTSRVHCKADGVTQVNGGGGATVEFGRLKIAFDQMKADHDVLVNLFNAHVHPGVLAGTVSTSATPTQGSPTTADIDPSKSETVEVP